MGSVNKMLLEIDGKPMLNQVIDQLLGSQIRDIIVLVGHESDMVRQVIPENNARISVLNNPNYLQGMNTSIALGARNLEDRDGCMVCLGDMPFITSTEYDQILVGLKHSDEIVVPRFREIPGNPVLFGSRYFPDLWQLDPTDQGAKEIIQKNREKRIFVEMQTNHIHQDIDRVPKSKK